MTYGGLTLEQLAAMERAATPGPWYVPESERFLICGPGRIDKYGSWVGVTGIGNVSGCVNFAKNAALIAAARNALPDLLREVEKLRAVCLQMAETEEAEKED